MLFCGVNKDKHAIFLYVGSLYFASQFFLRTGQRRCFKLDRNNKMLSSDRKNLIYFKYSTIIPALRCKINYLASDICLYIEKNLKAILRLPILSFHWKNPYFQGAEVHKVIYCYYAK